MTIDFPPRNYIIFRHQNNQKMSQQPPAYPNLPQQQYGQQQQAQPMQQFVVQVAYLFIV
jgi:hypothetical protein